MHHANIGTAAMPFIILLILLGTVKEKEYLDLVFQIRLIRESAGVETEAHKHLLNLALIKIVVEKNVPECGTIAGKLHPVPVPANLS